MAIFSEQVADSWAGTEQGGGGEHSLASLHPYTCLYTAVIHMIILIPVSKILDKGSRLKGNLSWSANFFMW